MAHQTDDAISEMSDFAEENEESPSIIDDNCGSNSDESDSGPGTEASPGEQAEDVTEIDPDRTEERFRVDRRKLEQMLQGKLNLYFKMSNSSSFFDGSRQYDIQNHSSFNDA